jgi:hypothetical protein
MDQWTYSRITTSALLLVDENNQSSAKVIDINRDMLDLTSGRNRKKKIFSFAELNFIRALFPHRLIGSRVRDRRMPIVVNSLHKSNL